MTHPSYDIALPDTLAAPLAEFIEALLAGEPFSRDYAEWASACVGKLRAGDGSFVSLDEIDMDMLEKDVLPEFFRDRHATLSSLLKRKAGKDETLPVLEEMTAATSLSSRLLHAVSYEVFDKDWKGDRA